MVNVLVFLKICKKFGAFAHKIVFDVVSVVKLFRNNSKNNFASKCCKFLANLCKSSEILEQCHVNWWLEYMDLSHIHLAIRPSAHLSTYHSTFFQSRLTYGFVATPIYSKELEGDSCFASIHPANRNKIQFLHTNTGCPSDLVPQRKLFFPLWGTMARCKYFFWFRKLFSTFEKI